MGQLADGFSEITIGSSIAGNINLASVGFVDPLVLQSGALITDAGDSGPDITNTGNMVTLDGTVTPSGSPGTFLVFGNTVLEDYSTLTLDLVGTPGGGTHDRFDVSGNVTIGSNVALSLNTSSYTEAAGSINIVENDDADAVTGTFSGLPEGDQTNGGGSPNFLIYYADGDGNDVVLTAATPTDVALSSFNALTRVGVPLELLALLVGIVLFGGYVVYGRWKRG